MPDVTKRLKQLIELKAQGNVSLFVEKAKLQSVQKLNRLFHVDKRNGKYPNPSSDLLHSIAYAFPRMSWGWLMSGEGTMFIDKESDSPAISDNDFEDNSARLVGVHDPDVFAPVRIIRYKVWASFVDNFNEFNFDDVQDTVQVYLPDIVGPITEDHMVFEILGDSMETTLMERAKVLAELVDDGNIEYINGGVYIIAYRNKLVAKRIINNDLLVKGTLTLHSDNPTRGNITIRRDDIRYIWHVTDIIGSKVK